MSKNDKGLKCFVDTDFAGGQSTNKSDNPALVYSRTGYIIKIKNCPILWASKLQSEISFTKTEAEYIALSQSMREITTIMKHLEKMEKTLNIELKQPSVTCKGF